MIDKRWRLWISVSLVVFSVISCGKTAGSTRLSIQGDPKVAQKGGTVSYSITYENTSEESSLREAVVVVRYSEHLSFNQNAIPFPDDTDEGRRELTWQLGTLKPGEQDSIRVEFKLGERIPNAVYELLVTAEISGIDSEGDRASRTQTGKTLIEGHPTPTPRPTADLTRAPTSAP